MYIACGFAQTVFLSSSDDCQVGKACGIFLAVQRKRAFFRESSINGFLAGSIVQGGTMMQRKKLKCLGVIGVAFVALTQGRQASAQLSTDRKESIKDRVALVLQRGHLPLQSPIGSGLVVNFPGGTNDCIYVITNAHVVSGEDTQQQLSPSSLIVVIHPKWLRKDRGLSVRSVARYDPVNDLALLEIESTQLSDVPKGYSIAVDSSATVRSYVTHFGFPKIRRSGTNDEVPWNSLRQMGVQATDCQIIPYEWIQKNGVEIDGSELKDLSKTDDCYFYIGPGGGEGGSGGGVFDENGNWIGVMVGGGRIARGKHEGKIFSQIIRPDVIASFLGTPSSSTAGPKPRGGQHDIWRMFRHDAQHTGRSTAIGPDTNRVRWVRDLEGDVGTPSFGPDGTIYVGAGNRLYALTTDGSTKWSFPAGRHVSAPAVGMDGTVYFGSSDNKLYAINPNGTEKWEKYLGNDEPSSPVIGDDGTLYVTFGPSVAAFSSRGELEWQVEPEGQSFCESNTPALGMDGTVYIGSLSKGIVYAFGPGKQEKWSYRAGGGSILSSPAVGSDGVIYSAAGNALVALRANGALLPRWPLVANADIRSSPAIASDGTIYFGTGRDRLYAVNPEGTKKWEYDTSHLSVMSSAAIGGDGTIYFSAQQKIIALSPGSGKLWELDAGDDVSSPSIGPDGTIFVGSKDNKLYAIGPGGR